MAGINGVDGQGGSVICRQEAVRASVPCSRHQGARRSCAHGVSVIDGTVLLLHPQRTFGCKTRVTFTIMRRCYLSNSELGEVHGVRCMWGAGSMCGGSAMMSWHGAVDVRHAALRHCLRGTCYRSEDVAELAPSCNVMPPKQHSPIRLMVEGCRGDVFDVIRRFLCSALPSAVLPSAGLSVPMLLMPLPEVPLVREGGGGDRVLLKWLFLLLIKIKKIETL